MHPQILFAHSYKVDHQKPCSAPLVFTKLHPSYHLNSTQPDHAMWQSPPFKISQPEQDKCHNPPLTKLTNQILPRHHLLHLTHEILTLIFLLSFQPPQPPPHLLMPSHHRRPTTTTHQRRRPHSRRCNTGSHRDAPPSRPSSPQFRRTSTPRSSIRAASIFTASVHTTCASSSATISTTTQQFVSPSQLQQCRHRSRTILRKPPCWKMLLKRTATASFESTIFAPQTTATPSVTAAPHASVSAIAPPPSSLAGEGGAAPSTVIAISISIASAKTLILERENALPRVSI